MSLEKVPLSFRFPGTQIPYTNLFRGLSFPEKLINAVVIVFHLLQTRRGSGCLRVTDREPDNGELAAISEQVNKWCLA